MVEVKTWRRRTVRLGELLEAFGWGIFVGVACSGLPVIPRAIIILVASLLVASGRKESCGELVLTAIA